MKTKATFRKIIQVLITCIILSCCLSSCSKFRIGYQFSDWLMERQIDKMFDLNNIQRQELKGIIARLFHWFESEEIPRVINLLEQAKNKLKIGLNENDMNWLTKEWDKMKSRFSNQVVDDITILLATISDDQINHLENWLDETEQELLDELDVPSHEWKLEQERDFIDGVENWFGELSKPQQEKVLKAVHLSKKSYKCRRLRNLIIGKRLTEFLRRDHTQEQLKYALNQWIMKPETLLPVEYLEMCHQQDDTARFLLMLDQIMNHNQRLKVMEKINSYQADLVASA